MNENLKHGNPATQFKSGRKAVENGKKGGIASGKAKRKKRELKSVMQMLLDLPINDKEVIGELERLGVDISELDNNTRLMFALLKKAFNGDVQAIKEVCETVKTEEDEKDSSFNVVFDKNVKKYIEE